MQISYVLTGKIDSIALSPCYTEKEVIDGLTLVWTTPEEALRLIE
jgi:hypothetical protein